MKRNIGWPIVVVLTGLLFATSSHETRVSTKRLDDAVREPVSLAGNWSGSWKGGSTGQETLCLLTFDSASQVVSGWCRAIGNWGSGNVWGACQLVPNHASPTQYQIRWEVSYPATKDFPGQSTILEGVIEHDTGGFNGKLQLTGSYDALCSFTMNRFRPARLKDSFVELDQAIAKSSTQKSSPPKKEPKPR